MFLRKMVILNSINVLRCKIHLELKIVEEFLLFNIIYYCIFKRKSPNVLFGIFLFYDYKTTIINSYLLI